MTEVLAAEHIETFLHSPHRREESLTWLRGHLAEVDALAENDRRRLFRRLCEGEGGRIDSSTWSFANEGGSPTRDSLCGVLGDAEVEYPLNSFTLSLLTILLYRRDGEPSDDASGRHALRIQCVPRLLQLISRSISTSASETTEKAATALDTALHDGGELVDDGTWGTIISCANADPSVLRVVAAALAHREAWDVRVEELLGQIPAVTSPNQRMAAARIVQSCRRLRYRSGLDMRRVLELVARWIASGAAVMQEQAKVAPELRTYSDAGLSVGDAAVIPPLYVSAVMDACKASVHPSDELPSLAHACFKELRDVTWRVQSFLTWTMDPMSFAMDFWGAPAKKEDWKPHQTQLFVDLVQLGIHPGLAAKIVSDEEGAQLLLHDDVSEIAQRIFENAVTAEVATSLDGRAAMMGNEHILCRSTIESLCDVQKHMHELGVPLTVGEVYVQLVANTVRFIQTYVKAPPRDSGEGELADESCEKAQELIIVGNTAQGADALIEMANANNAMDKARFWLFSDASRFCERIMDTYPPPSGKDSWMHTTTRNHALSLLAGIDIEAGAGRRDFGRSKSFYLTPMRGKSDVEFQMKWARRLLSGGTFPLPREPKLVSFIYHLDGTGNTLDLSDASDEGKSLWRRVVAASRTKGRFPTDEEQIRIDEGRYDSVYGPVAVPCTACDHAKPYANAKQLDNGKDRAMQLAIKKQSFADHVSLQLAAAIVWSDPPLTFTRN